jgi:hypothetical protein
MRDYGSYGRPVMLFEAYESWRDDMRSRLEEAGGVALQEADTRFDFPSFLFGPLRQSMFRGYDEVETNFRNYVAVENAPDFRERRLRGLTGMTKPGYVGEHGEFPQMRRGERQQAGLVIDTYGGTYSMTRHLIINDETNELLNSAPQEMGRASAEFITETIISFIESNPNAPDGDPMWSVGRGNHTTALLSEDSLAAGVAVMTKRRDPMGRRITVRPSRLVVADPKWQLVANRILNSTETGVRTSAETGTAVFDKGTDNVVRNIIPNGAVTYDPFFNDDNNWFLLADPGRVPAFAVGFLNGQDRPRVYLKNPEIRGVLNAGADPYTYELRSLDWLVEFDFGVAAVDPLGIYVSTPA